MNLKEMLNEQSTSPEPEQEATPREPRPQLNIRRNEAMELQQESLPATNPNSLPSTTDTQPAATLTEIKALMSAAEASLEKANKINVETLEINRMIGVTKAEMRDTLTNTREELKEITQQTQESMYPAYNGMTAAAKTATDTAKELEKIMKNFSAFMRQMPETMVESYAKMVQELDEQRAAIAPKPIGERVKEWAIKIAIGAGLMALGVLGGLVIALTVLK